MAASLQEVIDLQSTDLEAARALADEYVAANESDFTELATRTIEQLVKAVDVFREAELVDSQHKVEVWLLHHYEPQTIGGTAPALVRVAS